MSLAACSPSDANGPFAGSGAGKADSASGACEGAALDTHGFCRLPNGEFTFDECCELPAEPVDEDGTFDESSGMGCIFGDHLVMMARMADLSSDHANTITATSDLPDIQRLQLLDVMNETALPATNLAEVVEQTDDEEIDLLLVEDLAHGRQFHMYIWSAGDNTVGRIYYSQSLRVAAEIGDGSIFDCDAGFSNYDDLPWFYSN